MFLTPAMVRPALIRSVHDGDTFFVDLDLETKALGLDLWVHNLKVRLAGCNARELAEPGGPEAAANLDELLAPGTPVTLAVLGVDDYGGRVDATVTLPTGIDLTALLVAEDWAAVWTGRGTKPVPPWPRPTS